MLDIMYFAFYLTLANMSDVSYMSMFYTFCLHSHECEYAKCISVLSVCVQCASVHILRPTAEEAAELPPCTTGEFVSDRVSVFMVKTVCEMAALFRARW